MQSIGKWLVKMITVVLLGLLAVSGLSPLYAQGDDEALQDVVDAYESYAAWETYTAQSATSYQIALTLDVDDLRLNETDSYVRYFDAAYAVPVEGVEGDLEINQTNRVSTNDNDPDTTRIGAQMQVVSRENDIYFQGSANLTNNEDETQLSYEVYTSLMQVADDLIPMLNIQRAADYSEFRNIEDFIDLLENAETIEGPSETRLRQVDGTLNLYQLTINDPAVIDALNINLQDVFAVVLETEAVENDVFFEAARRNSEVTVAAYLDPESGRLVAENVVLTIAFELGSDDLLGQNENNALVVDYNYQLTALYNNINEPVEIELPTSVDGTPTPDSTDSN